MLHCKEAMCKPTEPTTPLTGERNVPAHKRFVNAYSQEIDLDTMTTNAMRLLCMDEDSNCLHGRIRRNCCACTGVGIMRVSNQNVRSTLLHANHFRKIALKAFATRAASAAAESTESTESTESSAGSHDRWVRSVAATALYMAVKVVLEPTLLDLDFTSEHLSDSLRASHIVAPGFTLPLSAALMVAFSTEEELRETGKNTRVTDDGRVVFGSGGYMFIGRMVHTISCGMQHRMSGIEHTIFEVLGGNLELMRIAEKEAALAETAALVIKKAVLRYMIDRRSRVKKPCCESFMQWLLHSTRLNPASPRFLMGVYSNLSTCDDHVRVNSSAKKQRV